MRQDLKKRLIKSIIWFALVIALTYGAGRLYYMVTGGFTIGNITFALPYDERWITHTLNDDEKNQLDQALSQKYSYLGKGCQSYVFASEDGRYVIKFFKYQRFRTQPWIDFFTFIPAVENYRIKKMNQKREKLETLFNSWKIAYEQLPEQTGVIYIHLNKTRDLNKEVVIYDKMGLEHKLFIDDYEFLIQHKAKLLTAELNTLMASGNEEEAKTLINNLIELILNEYATGFADNDHALMQNTGILDGRPIHIDVGQFVRNPRTKNPDLYKQELFNKTWKFHNWLKKNHPSLAQHLEDLLKTAIGETEFLSMKPNLDKETRLVISHQE